MVDRTADNMLKVSTDGRKAALDLTLVVRQQEYDNTSKVMKCVKKVTDIYSRYEGCSQIVFCDYSTPKASDFNVYTKLRELLILNGIPKNEIAFIHSYNTEEKKLSLYNKVNEGVVRILIGSTFKLGIGANVQTKLKAIHHLDIPWRPADMVQREGRILRRGNENERVYIYRYIAEGSFDSYSWQILETKQRFISQFLSGTSYQRSIADLESDVLSYGEVKALALSSPLMKRLAEKENELRNIRILSPKHCADHICSQHELEGLKKELKFNNNKLKAAREYLEYSKNITDSEYSMIYRKYKSLFTRDVITGEAMINDDVNILGFDIKMPEKQPEKKSFLQLGYNGYIYEIKTGNSASGNIQRILNFIKRFYKTVTDLEKHSIQLKKQISETQKILSANNPYSKQIAVCENEIKIIREKLNLENQLK